ncbi:MAG: ATP-binding protein [Desulfurivibrio sp.]|nr:ATP-binding protein [Desulfurivibrio sp.]
MAGENRRLFWHLYAGYLLVALSALLVVFWLTGVATRGLYQQLAGGALLMALLVAVVAWFSARRLSYPLEEIRRAAERFADGNFGSPVRAEGVEEVVSLALAVNRMAEQLGFRLRANERQRQQLQTVFAAMVEGVITVDANQRLTGINQAAARLLAVDPERVRGQNIRLALPNPGLQELVQRTLANPAPSEGEFTLLDAGGRERYCRANGVLLSAADDREEAGAVLVLSDLTRLRRLENLRRDFVANVSHELKTPITSIEGFAETLLDGALEEPEQAHRFVAVIQQQARRLNAIIEDLLTLSRIEQEGRSPTVQLQYLPLQAPLGAAVESCKPAAAAKEIELQVVGESAGPAWINPALLEQALVNLIDNAIKYSPAGRLVRIEVASADGELTVAVADQGQGIPAADLSRIFERFYRADKARSARLGGTGLGLAIVKHIVQVHGGRVEVESTVGRGSTFTIFLSRQRPPAGAGPDSLLIET